MAVLNLATYLLNAATVAARNAEITGTPFSSEGMNLGGSNAPGIGINTGDINPKLSDWTTLDQAAAARDPQDSQHIGGDALGDGDQTSEPVRCIQGADVNDTLGFSVADTAAVADAVYDVGGTGAVNKTGETVAICDRIWGPIPVA